MLVRWTCVQLLRTLTLLSRINELNSYSANNCPGVFEPPFDYPQWTDEPGRDVVHWRLLDRDGFRTFLNDTLGLDLNDLVPGTILVNRAGKRSFDKLVCRLLTANSERLRRHSWPSDEARVVKRHSVGKSRRFGCGG